MSAGNTLKDGTGTTYWLVVDSNGNLQVSGGVAHDAVDANNPVKIGGVYRSTAPAVASGDVVDLLMDAAGRVQVRDGYTMTAVLEETQNDNDKTITVPASTEYIVDSIAIYWTSDATAGNRQVQVDVYDDNDDIFLELYAGTTQAASLSRSYYFVPDIPSETSFGGPNSNILYTQMPSNLLLGTGWYLNIKDASNISGSDDMSIYIRVRSRSV